MRTVVHRASWGLFDQALSSASNFGLSAFIAANVSVNAFGAFTVVYAVYNMCVGFSEGLVSIPLIVRYSAATGLHASTAVRASVGAALIVGVITGAGCLAFAPLMSSAVAGPLAALGATLPGLLTQDAWRYSFMAKGQPAKAAANDGLWILLQLIGVVVLLLAGAVSAMSMVLLWGVSATAAALLGCWQAQAVPAPRQALVWLREQRAFTVRYAVEILLHRSGFWLSLTAVGAVAGLQVLGALRGALLLLGGPLNLLFVGAMFALIPEGVRLLQRSPGRLPRAMRNLSAVSVTIAAIWCLIVLALPAGLGQQLLGDTWKHTQPLLPWLIAVMIALAASMGAIQGMLALGAARRSLFTQAVSVGIDVPVMTLGAVLAGSRGAAVATSLTAVLRTVLAWVQFRRALVEPPASLGLASSQGTAPVPAA